MKRLRYIALAGMLLFGLLGCTDGVTLSPSEAQANLATTPDTRVQKSRNNLEETQGAETWDLYRNVYCAEKAGAPFLVDAYLDTAGETRQSWERRLDDLVQNIREGREGAAQQWQQIADTPCEQD